jgi:hypothetical protein
MKIGKTAFGAFVFILALVWPVANAAPIQWLAINGGNDHYYEVVPAGDLPWATADVLATASFIEPIAGTRIQGHLATVTSVDENTFIHSLLPTTHQYWLGGFQPTGSPEPGGGWQWVNGEGAIPTSTFPVPGGYSNWLGGEPNNASGGTEHELTIGIFGSALWNDSIPGVGAIGGYVVEYDGVVDAGTCVPDPDTGSESCNPSGVMTVQLPDDVVLPAGATITQNLVEVSPGIVQRVDPRVDGSGQCSTRAPLDVFGDGSLILPEFLCGSPKFAVLRSDGAGFEVLRDVVRSAQLPEEIFGSATFDCDDPGGLRDLQERGVFVWQPDETEVAVLEGRALELTNGCGSSRGATRELSYFVLNLHIDCGIPFGTNDPGVLQCFVDLTNDKFANLGIALENSKTSLNAPTYGKLRSLWSSAADNFLIGNYAKALARLDGFISRVNSADFDTGSGFFNHQGNVLMRAENIRFMITDKVDPAP